MPASGNLASSGWAVAMALSTGGDMLDLHPVLAGVALTLVAAHATPASAIIMRHDVPESDYLVDASDHPYLVDLFEPGDCLGTLIRDDAVLTVAHCAVDLKRSDTLTFAGVAHGIAAIRIHPDYRGFRDDIAMVFLTEPVVGIEPVPVYRGSDEAGAVLTLVGRGIHGTGQSGERGGEDDGQLRRATNRVHSASRHWLEVVFDAPGDVGVLPLEGVGAAGDSGGPAFIDTPTGPQLAGLNSWGEGGRGVRVGEYGARDYATRVSRQLDWLDGELSGNPIGPSRTG
ncbi:MAG TPA: hypothetical protein DFR83_25350, partial [Deltaproteobacteria bacterium]|nr:hypothetical protein [Deltaproteobacteria bacterium]